MRLYYVYILSNRRRTVYYIGQTNNLRRRLEDHRGAIWGARFTRKYNAHDLLYFEVYPSRQAAQDREREIKAWRREKKLNLIRHLNPGLKTLCPPP